MAVPDDVNQQYDRITEMLRQSAQPAAPTQSDYEAAALGNMYNPGQFVQQTNNMEHDGQQQALQTQMNIMKVFEAKKAAGDANAKALDEKIHLFTGGDPDGTALFLQELHNDPEAIDPSNSYQVLTKLAGIKKRTGYESPMLSLKKQEDEAKIAKLRAEANAPKGGATGELIRQLMAENPNMTFEQALYSVQTGMRQGTKIENGKVVAVPGVGKALGENKFGEHAGAKAGDKAGETVQTAIEDLPSVVANAENNIKDLKELVDHPGFSYAVGKSSILPVMPGSNAADFMAKLEKVKGTQFLQAYQLLKGAGQISEVEGAKAEAAIAAMQRTQSEEGFKKSVKDFTNVIEAGVARAKAKAGKSVAGVPAQPTTVTTPDGWSIVKKGE